MRAGRLLLQPGSELGASRGPDWLGRAVLSRSRQALGEGARRDWDTVVGVTEGSSGTVEPRSSRELGHLKSTSQNKSRPRCGDPSPPAPPWRACARHPAHLRQPPAQSASHRSLPQPSPHSEQILQPAASSGACKRTNKAGPTCSPQDPGCSVHPCRPAQHWAGREQVLSTFFFFS